jgi:hypothetical protein
MMMSFGFELYQVFSKCDTVKLICCLLELLALGHFIIVGCTLYLRNATIQREDVKKLICDVTESHVTQSGSIQWSSE